LSGEGFDCWECTDYGFWGGGGKPRQYKPEIKKSIGGASPHLGKKNALAKYKGLNDVFLLSCYPVPLFPVCPFALFFVCFFVIILTVFRTFA